MPLLRYVCRLALLTGFATSLSALSVDPTAIANRAIFGIHFPESNRAYHARENAILSISQQEYITASFSVVELNIITDGTALLRIYHSRALQPGELQEALSNGISASGAPASIIRRPLPAQIQAMADRANGSGEALTSSAVIKEYPHATHAHTVEFRITSRSELLELHNALKQHWLKEPAFFENGQIVSENEATDKEMKPRSLGGTVFTLEK